MRIAAGPGRPTRGAARSGRAADAACRGGPRRFTAEDVERGCPASTLGEYLALLEANTRPDPVDPSAIVSLEGGCAEGVPTSRHGAFDGLWPAPDEAFWLCHVDAFASDAAGESPWHYELRVRVRRDERRVDPTWLACPGLP